MYNFESLRVSNWKKNQVKLKNLKFILKKNVASKLAKFHFFFANVKFYKKHQNVVNNFLPI